MDLPARPAGRFRPALLFRPRSLAVIGAESTLGTQVRANLAAGGFAGAVQAVGRVGELREPAELVAVCALEEPAEAAFATLARMGSRVAVMLCPPTGMAAGELGASARAAGIRLMGPGAFGIAVPRAGLNLSAAHLPVPAGRLALVSQSAALCRAVLDWAGPNGVGFSTIAGLGGNADVGFGLVLDWLSRDPDTGAILLDIRSIRDPRAFVSAARAAARQRPVVAIRAGGRLADPDGLAEAVFDGVLRRCGVLGVESLGDLLAAAETLTRAKPARGEGLAIVTNALGPAGLAADAALRDGLGLAALAPATQDLLRLAAPAPVRGLVHAGAEAPARLAELARLLGAAPEVGGVLVVHAPTGPGDASAMAALGTASQAMKAPLLVAAMGETGGAAHRRTLAAAGVPAFATPEEAVRGFLHLVQHRRIRASLRELPDSVVAELAVDAAAAAAVVAAAEATGRRSLRGHEAARLLGAYGIRLAEEEPAGGVVLRARLTEDAMFGAVVAIGQGGLAGRLLGDVAVDLPPLTPALAHGLIDHVRAGAEIGGVPGGQAAVAELLVRLSRIAVDLPQVAAVDLDPLWLDAAGLRAGGARIVLRAPDQADSAGRLAIPPYPVERIRRIAARDEALVIRPVRPEDAAAHAEFFARLSPEDVRFRFFSAIRALSREQIARLTQVDYEREMALLAVRPATPGGLVGETVGVARLVREVDTGEAEFAVVVQGDMKGRSVARALMVDLLEWGRAKGVREVFGQVLADNAPMLAFVRRLGFAVRRVPGEPDVLEARLALA